MTCYSNLEVEALRWQLARFFPRLDVKDTRRMPISDNPRAVKRRDVRAGLTQHSLNLQTSMWHAYQAASTSLNKNKNGRGHRSSKNRHQQARHVPVKTTPQNRRLRQLYIEYKTLASQSGRDSDTTRDPFIADALRHARDDPDKAVEILQQALGSNRLVEALACSRHLGQWRRTWQEKRCERLHEAKRDASSQALSLPPLPPPLPPCLQCVLANTCCSLTATPYAQAFANDRTGADRPAERLSLRDVYAKLIAEHRSLGVRSRTDATLAQKKRELDRQLLLRAIIAGDCESPFLPSPPAQCARCCRMGEKGCLQQSKDLTGTADVLDLDENGNCIAVWFASSGPPPESLLVQHCQPLLRQIRGLGVADAALDDSEDGNQKRQRRQPLLEAVFCRDSSAMSAVQVTVKAESLLRSIFRQKQANKGVGQASCRTAGPRVRGLAHCTDALRPDNIAAQQRSSFRMPQMPQGKRPVQPASPLDVTLRLPKWSLADVHAGHIVATAALSYGCNSEAGGQWGARAGDSFAPAPCALPGWLPRMNGHGGTEPTYGWHDYFLDVSEDRAAAEFKKKQQNADRKKRNLGEKSRKAADGRGRSTERRQKQAEQSLPPAGSGCSDTGDGSEEGSTYPEEKRTVGESGQAQDLQSRQSWRDEMFRIRLDECRARMGGGQMRRYMSKRGSIDEDAGDENEDENEDEDEDEDGEINNNTGALSWEQVVMMAQEFGVQPEKLERFRQQKKQAGPGLAVLCRTVAKMLHGV